MQQYGWKCIHYGTQGCEVPCETVICLDAVGPDHEADVAAFNAKAGNEIRKRKQPKDVIVCFYGSENKPACEMNPDLKSIEPSIGYTNEAVFATYKGFVSYAHMHYYYGMKGMLMNPSWYDTVIYNGITASEFDFNEKKEDYFLCFGRIIEHKGIHLAIQATEATGKKLILAGRGSLQDMGYSKTPSHVEVIGPCDVEQRRKVMAGAKAILGLTYYVEPFGNMVAEGFMSGTPAITTDWGGFAETNINGVTGFRCKEFRDVVHAIENIDSISNQACRDHAMKNFEDNVTHPHFDTWFKKIIADNFYRL